MTLTNQAFVGRDAEMAALRRMLDATADGQGCAAVVSGEAGMGKTMLVARFAGEAARSGAMVFRGGAAASRLEPFDAIAAALAGALPEGTFGAVESVQFSQVLAFDVTGALLAKSSASAGGEIPGNFAPTLSAVQDFVRDSLGGRRGGESASLGRLEWGKFKILIEGGNNVQLAAAFSGGEHPSMRSMLREASARIERSFRAVVDAGGEGCDLAQMVNELDALSNAKFTVRRDLAGVRLEGERVRMADAVLNALASIADKRPVVAVVEDLHWADESSAFVFGYLARNAADVKLMLVGTWRPSEGGAFLSELAALRNVGTAIEIDLSKLDRKGVEGILAARFPMNDFPTAFAEGLHAKCEGNPFFVSELLNQIAADGHISESGGVHSLSEGTLTIPDTLESVVMGRLEALGHGAMAMAEYVSCEGKAFVKELALSNPSIADPVPALADLCSRGILVRSDAGFAFSHALFQEIIYKGLAKRWRPAHHKSLGEYYERTCGSDLGAAAYELARHFSETSEHGKAYNYCRAAGERAESSYAVEQAIYFNLKALEMMPLAHIDAASRADGESSIRERLGDSYTLAGEWESGLSSYARAMELEGEPLRIADLRRKIAGLFERQGEYDKSRAECDEGLIALGGTNSVEKARLVLSRGWTWLRTGEYAKATDDFAAGLAVASTIGDSGEIAYAHHSIGTVLLYRENYPDSLGHLGKALEMRERQGDIKGASRTLNNLGMVYSELGHFDRALESYERSLDMMRKTGDKNNQGNLAVNMGMTYSDIGDLDKALKCTLEGYSVAKRVGDKSGCGTALNNLGNIYFDLGQTDKSMENYLLALSLRKEIGDQYGTAMTILNMADQHLQDGDLHKARECFGESTRLFGEIGEKRGLSHAHTGLVDLSLAEGDAVSAEGHARKALAISVEIGARFEEAMSHHSLGHVFRLRKETARASEEYEKAAELFRAVKGIKDLAKVLYHHGLALLEGGEMERGAALISEARRRFEKMGMRAWLAKSSAQSGDDVSTAKAGETEVKK